MDPIDPRSLYRTVMPAVRLLAEGGRMAPAARAELASWILTHQNRKDGFLFHPTPQDERTGLALVSGEKPRTRLLADNAFELETLRLLLLLQDGEPGIGLVCEAADRRLDRLCFASVCTTGECAGATIAWLRYRGARGGAESLARRGLDALRRERDGTGRWRKFPFLYTLLWLLELPGGTGRQELAYALPALRRLASRRPDGGPLGSFRSRLVGRALQAAA